MKYTKKLALSITFACSLFWVFQCNLYASSLSRKIISIERINKSWQTISADFKQSTYISILDRTIVKHGKMLIKKGGRFRISYDKKYGKEYISDGTTVWIFSPDGSSNLETFTANGKNMPKEAINFMDGFGNLKHQFAISPSRAFDETCHKCTAIHLKPRSNKAFYVSLDILFGANDIAKKIIIANKSGNKTTYDFINVKLNKKLPDDLFTLHKKAKNR